MAMNEEITAIGRVSPVITVLRQLCRNRKTMATVSSAPSTSVRLTPLSESFTHSLSAYTRRSSTPGGSDLRSSSVAALMPSPVSTMLASCCLKTWKEMAGMPSTRDRESGSRSRSTNSPRSDSRSTSAPR